MALEGSLREFNLADILQLIFFQKKTGTLTLTGQADKVRLLFYEGNIVGAESRKRGSENRLGGVLVKRGVLSEEDLQSAVEKQKSEGGKLGSILVSEGYTTREQIQEVISFQINETMVQLFTWREGRYEFTPQAVPVDRDTGVVLDTQHFLMEGLRMVDEWSEIKDRITVDAVFLQTDTLPIDLDFEEQEIYSLVDGKSDVAAISEFSGRDSFSVSTTLLSLQEKGVIVKKQEKKPVVEEVPIPQRGARKIPALGFLLTVLLLGAFATSLYGAFIASYENGKAFRAAQEVDRLRYEVRIAHELRGAYPAAIRETDPWGNPYLYRLEDSSFDLMSAGPDGSSGTGDDIH